MLYRLVNQIRLSRAAKAAKAIKPQSIPKPLRSRNPITFPQKAVVEGLHAFCRGYPLLEGYLYILDITGGFESKDDKQSTKDLPASTAGFRSRLIQHLSFYSSGGVMEDPHNVVPPHSLFLHQVYLAFHKQQRSSHPPQLHSH